jgi:hypothetical protein
LAPGDRAEHHDALGSIDRRGRQKPGARITLMPSAAREADPENDLAHGHYPDQPVGNLNPGAGTDRSRKQTRPREQQRAGDHSGATGSTRAATKRRFVATRETERLDDACQTQGASDRSADTSATTGGKRAALQRGHKVTHP